MKILFIGDIVGRHARKVTIEKIQKLKQEHNFDFIIANGENASNGSGITTKAYDQLIGDGVDCLTSGNHIFRNQDIFNELDNPNTKILRPDNYPDLCPGKGYTLLSKKDSKLLVVNLMGRVFMKEFIADPFVRIEEILKKFKDIKHIFLDFHADATSEKAIMGYFLDGRISVLVGTHTHIQTADERILPHGTGFITDVGMVGALESSLGISFEDVLVKERTQMPIVHSVAEGQVIFNAVIIQLDQDGKCQKIQRIRELE